MAHSSSSEMRGMTGRCGWTDDTLLGACQPTDDPLFRQVRTTPNLPSLHVPNGTELW